MTGLPGFDGSVVGRRNRLLAAGLFDSLGLAIGWTAMSLHTVSVHGLRAFGMLSAAMMVGVALSAPFTGWLSARLAGRQLLRLTAGAEATLRAISFLALFSDAPVIVVVVLVAGSNILAWTGFAGMRAEIALLRADGVWLSAYTAGIAAAEALGAFVAAFLPTGGAGLLRPDVAAAAGAAYVISLAPTWLVAGDAQARKATSGRVMAALRGRVGVLLGGTGVTLLATGPTLLAVGLAAGLHGRGAVGPAMLLFAVGSLTGPKLADWLAGVDLPTPVLWSFLGVLMLSGWGLASVSVAGLLVAQLVSGVALGAFEGVMDARVAGTGNTDSMTGGLAWAGAARAFGSALAVSATPVAMSAVGVGRSAALATIALAASALAAGLLSSLLPRRRRAMARRHRVGSHVSAHEWIAVLSGDVREARRLAADYRHVDVCRCACAADLVEAGAKLPAPLLVVVGTAVPDADVLAVETMVAADGPWAGAGVLVVAANRSDVRMAAGAPEPSLALAAA